MTSLLASLIVKVTSPEPCGRYMTIKREIERHTSLQRNVSHKLSIHKKNVFHDSLHPNEIIYA